MLFFVLALGSNMPKSINPKKTNPLATRPKQINNPLSRAQSSVNKINSRKKNYDWKMNPVKKRLTYDMPMWKLHWGGTGLPPKRMNKPIKKVKKSTKRKP